MTKKIRTVVLGVIVLLALACGAAMDEGGGHGEEHRGEEVRGPNGGRLLSSGGFELELAIFERGAPPEFRAWSRENEDAVAPTEVELEVELERLGGALERIEFEPSGRFLRGTSGVVEPHSFTVSVRAVHRGRTHRWSYDQFEGRARITPEMARELGIVTEPAGSEVLRETLEVYGRVRANPERVREIRARFDGAVRAVYAEVGSSVERGAKLFRVESDESLNAYEIVAPIAGVVTQRDANPGEQTKGRLLMTLADVSSVWAELSLFPSDRGRVRTGNEVRVASVGGGDAAVGQISAIEVVARPNQSVLARVVLENEDGRLVPGTLVTARVSVAEERVPLAVRRDALQSSGGKTVVYVQVGDVYEARTLKLGRRTEEWAEVLGGLEPGADYVTANSYVVRADIEKSGAAHHH